jgi:hypothetical protein
MLSLVSLRYPCPVKRDDGSPNVPELHKLISADTTIPAIFITLAGKLVREGQCRSEWIN